MTHGRDTSLRGWPAGERPREKLFSRGAAALSDGELLALLLGAGSRGRNALQLALDCLADHGCLRALLNASPSSLSAQPGLGPARAARIVSAMELARRSLRETLQRHGTLDSPTATQRFLNAQLRDRDHEVFCCLYLDNRHRIIAFQEVFRGTIDGASVHPREVVKLALAHNAAAVIFAHNHPSGIAEPSAADERITERLRQALALVEIRVLDHVVVGDGVCVSFAERGLL